MSAPTLAVWAAPWNLRHWRFAAVDGAQLDLTNLAWGRAGGGWALFVLWENGEVVRLFPETGEQDTLALPPMAALAGDSNGSIAMLAWEEQRVFVSDGSEDVTFRQIGMLNSIWGVIIALTGFLLPYGIIILAPYFASIPQELDDAARPWARRALPAIGNGSNCCSERSLAGTSRENSR